MSARTTSSTGSGRSSIRGPSDHRCASRRRSRIATQGRSSRPEVRACIGSRSRDSLLSLLSRTPPAPAPKRNRSPTTRFQPNRAPLSLRHPSQAPQIDPEGADLRDEGRSGRGLVLEGRRELRLGAVVAGEAVDTRLDENEAELGVWSDAGRGDACQRVLADVFGDTALCAGQGRQGRQPMAVRSRDAPLSWRLRSRCLRTWTAFLMRWYRSSGICGARPAVLRMRRILLPVTDLTWATPCESRRMTPICDGVRPLRASLKICSLISSGEVLSQRGAERL